MRLSAAERFARWGLVLAATGLVTAGVLHPERSMTLNDPWSPATLTVRATAYNSLPEQTDADPFITARGTLARQGVIAVSRDLLSGALPFGTVVRIRSAQGVGSREYWDFPAGLLVVEDTMHSRKRDQIDLWFESRQEALRWGVREVTIEIVRPGTAATAWAR